MLKYSRPTRIYGFKLWTFYSRCTVRKMYDDDHCLYYFLRLFQPTYSKRFSGLAQNVDILSHWIIKKVLWTWNYMAACNIIIIESSNMRVRVRCAVCASACAFISFNSVPFVHVINWRQPRSVITQVPWGDITFKGTCNPKSKNCLNH